MTEISPLTTTSAPAASRPILETAQRSLGFVPNLYATLAHSPLALISYTELAQTIAERSTLTATEQQVVFLAASLENGCDYCVAAHSTLALAQKVDAAVLDAVRAKEPISDGRLEALRQTTIALVKERGWLSETQTRAFVDAGFERAQLLDVVTLLALKTISNYTNHLADTPIDAAFQAQRLAGAA